jgi:hypothetical protein
MCLPFPITLPIDLLHCSEKSLATFLSFLPSTFFPLIGKRVIAEIWPPRQDLEDGRVVGLFAGKVMLNYSI